MFKNLFKLIFQPIYKLFLWPPLRYSDLFASMFFYDPREEVLRNIIKFVATSNIDGDYLEFGVFEGETFIHAFNFAKKSGLEQMKFYAFDSFEGLPEIKGFDAEGLQFRKGQYSCSVERFKKVISAKGVNLNKVCIVPGWYNEVLNESTKKRLPIKRAAIVYVDCDLYESTVPVMDFITDYIQDGTVIIFDDFFCFRGKSNRGEQKAFWEWLKKNPSIKVTEFHKFGWHGNSFIIHKGNE